MNFPALGCCFIEYSEVVLGSIMTELSQDESVINSRRDTPLYMFDVNAQLMSFLVL